ncbi:hypothetical protein [Actinomadura sp. 21ATH]|uniref:hypothetical protein n=1 Tax=Actinomadura sp. 21ATH TaxID=1735444 RepID=UPI0035C02421
MKIEKYELKSEFALHYAAIGRAEGEAEGEARGKARAIVKILSARGLEPSEADRTRIQACTDKDQLDRWLDRAVTAETVDEIFD